MAPPASDAGERAPNGIKGSGLRLSQLLGRCEGPRALLSGAMKELMSAPLIHRRLHN